MIDYRTPDQMYGHGEYPGMYDGRNSEHRLYPPVGFNPEMPAGIDFRARIEKEERFDETLKKLRDEAAITGDLSQVISYKRSKAKEEWPMDAVME